MKRPTLTASPRILVIAGPTASGKTEVAYEISKTIPAEIISCDSMQVYKGMSLVTQASANKPGTKRKGGASLPRTHLVSFIPPSKEYSAARFRKDAIKLIHKIIKKKKIPIITCGTGLYLRALLDGLFESKNTSDKDEALRKQLLSQQEMNGGNYLHEQLNRVDPQSAHKIHPNDIRRVVRALEVFTLTKKPISEQKPNRKGIRDEFDCRIFVLNRDREELYGKINRRVDRMLKEGLLDEVKKLIRKDLSQTAQMALGVREIARALSGELNLHQSIELLKKNTRNYAKRQLSWFRHERGAELVPVIAEEKASETADRILQMWAKPDA